MKPILCVGDAHVDMMFPSQTTLQLQQQAAKGEDVSQRVQSQVVATPGGIILNTAGALARLGVSTMYGGSLGTDRFGRMAVEHMENLGVDVSCAVFKPQYATMMVFCIISESGDRDFRMYPVQESASTMLDYDDLPADITDRIGMFFFTGAQLMPPHTRACVLKLAAQCKQKGIPVVFDVNLRIGNFGWDEEKRAAHLQAVQMADIVFGSGEEELCFLAETQSVPDAVHKLRNSDSQLFVAKNGALGATLYTDFDTYQIGVYNVEVVDTVGAGDVFNAGFLAAYTRKMDLAHCLWWGTAAAAYSLQFEGGSVSPDEVQLLKFMDSFDPPAMLSF